MKKRRSIAAWVLGIVTIAALIWLIFPRDKEEGTADRAEVRADESPRQPDNAGATASEPGTEEADPASAGKFKERPGPEEVAKLRYERKRRELVERMNELKKAGLGDVHPVVRAAAGALEKLDAEQGGGQ